MNYETWIGWVNNANERGWAERFQSVFCPGMAMFDENMNRIGD